MKRYKAIDAVCAAILNGGLAQAVFLKGSIARGEDDAYSDVDMYAAVSRADMPRFLENRLAYLNAYMPVVFYTHANFVGPQVICVYEDGLHFDLYTVPADAIPQTEDIKILHDESGLLASYEKVPYTMDDAQVIEQIDEISFMLLEFEAAFARGDRIWAVRLLNGMMLHMALILRCVYDPPGARLGARGLYKHLPPEMLEGYMAVLEKQTPGSMDEAIRLFIRFKAKVISKLPVKVQLGINHAFYNMMDKRIFELLKRGNA